MILGIIGTAGRGPDGARITLDVWNAMKVVAGKFIKDHKIENLISGGASYADHIAVQAFNANFIKSLTLELPSQFDLEDVMYEPDGAGIVSNLYHQKFHQALNVNSLFELKTAIEKGAIVNAGGGFFARNTIVAQKADILLAFTFGASRLLKEGGTADTVRKFLKKNGQNSDNAWHCDLNDMKLYQNAEVPKKE